MAMQAIIASGTSDNRESATVASLHAIQYAQALQKALDELEPKCEHKGAGEFVMDEKSYRVCYDCGVRL
jgi:hypothetical protein